MSSESLRIHEFARRAGVTVKALRHYDRLGLLSAVRTMSGHRVYSPRDLARVKEITALKLLGLPLRRIKTLLEAGCPPLRAILQEQRNLDEDPALPPGDEKAQAPATRWLDLDAKTWAHVADLIEDARLNLLQPAVSATP